MKSSICYKVIPYSLVKIKEYFGRKFAVCFMMVSYFAYSLTLSLWRQTPPKCSLIFTGLLNQRFLFIVLYVCKRSGYQGFCRIERCLLVFSSLTQEHRLIQWNTTRLEKLMLTQLTKNILRICGTLRLSTEFTRFRH
jgi:hypothetical protein